MVELPSRELVIDQLVRGCLDFPANRRPSDVPVIILSGVQGSDKTSVLTDIRQRCAGVRPCVLRDLTGDHGSRPYEIIAHLAYGLSTRTKQFGELGFPRLLLGLIVVSGGLDRHDRRKARNELNALLYDNRRLTDKARDVGQGLLSDIGLPMGSSVILGLALNGISAAFQTVRVLRGKALRWYREGTGQRFEDPLDALIALHSWQAEGTPRARADVDESLCSAFLADLRASFRDGWQAHKRTGNCVVMLDEADSPEGQGLLRALMAARQTVHSREGCDPLLVIAAGHTRFPVLTRADGRIPAARTPALASRADWDSQRDGTAQSWLYPVRLGPADERDRKVLERRWPAVTTVPGALAFAQRLTDGHPAGLRLILAGISAQASQKGLHQVDLRDVLDWPDRGSPARDLADAALELMLRNASASLRQDLITCSAAADMATASRRHALGLPAGTVSGALDRFCATDLWVSPAHESARPVLAPFLRRVLWHALGNRQGDALDDWQTVHTRLQTYYRDDRGDEPAALRHGLAMGDVESTVQYLASRLRSVPSRQWLAELGAITQAPRIAAPATRTPRDQVAHYAPAKDTLSRLVTAMWISNDPLGDPHGSLDVLIAADLNSLASEATDDSELYDEAERISKRQNGSQL